MKEKKIFQKKKKYIYIYIYRERERETERDKDKDREKNLFVSKNYTKIGRENDKFTVRWCEYEETK